MPEEGVGAGCANFSYRIEKLQGTHHHRWDETVFVILHDVEALAKDEITHDVVREICAPVAHILLGSPFPRLRPFCQMVAPNADVVDDEGLGRSDGAIGEGVVQHPSPECVALPVDLAVGARSPCGGIQVLVPLRLLNVCFTVGIDFL